MEAMDSSETSMDLYQNTCCYNPEDRTLPVREILRVKPEMFDYGYYVTWNNNNLSVGV
jgi:hypothetical protein